MADEGGTPASSAAAAIARSLLLADTFDGTPLFDLAPNGILAIDGAGVIVYANAPLLSTFGYEHDDLIGRDLEVLVPGRLAEAHRAHRDRRSRHPHDRAIGRRDLQLVGVRRDGTEFPVDVGLGTLTRDGVEVTLAVVADLTAHRSVESRLQEVTHAYATLEALTRQMRGGRDEAAVLELACNLAVTEGRYLGAWAAQPDEHGRVRVAASAGTVEDYLSGLVITLDPVSPGPIALALTEGTATFIEDFDDHVATTPWIAAARQHGIRACATLPVRLGSDIVAVLVFYSGRPDVFDTEMRAVLEGIAATVRTHLEHARSTAQLHEAEQQRSALLERLIVAEELERSKIAADVHDDSIGALAAVSLRLGRLQTKASAAVPELSEMIEELRSTVSAAAERLRNLLFDLETPDPRTDLGDALRSAAAYVFDHSEAVCHVAVEVSRPPDANTYTQTVRIVKEALLNVRAHASATTVRVTVRDRDRGLEVVIEDDGVGFDPRLVSSRPGHRGLVTMRDRAQLSGGTLDIRPADGGGTVIAVWLPRTGHAPT